MVSMASAFAGSYLIGSIPTGFLVVKWVKRIDVRSVGSGNVGATNVARVAGKEASAVVFLLDMVKGLLAVGLIAPWVLGVSTASERLACGLAAVVGHSFPVFLKFHGGKGVATTIGVLLGATPVAAGVFLLTWVVCVARWRYVSVGSMAAAATIPIVQLALHRPWPEQLLGVLFVILIVARHRTNLERLRRGEEHRIGRRR